MISRARAWSSGGMAPNYEQTPSHSHEGQPASAAHGGYGVLTEAQTIIGPFAWYDNARRVSSRVHGSHVVRWLDFVTVSVLDQRFALQLAIRKAPFIIPVHAFGATRVDSYEQSIESESKVSVGEQNVALPAHAPDQHHGAVGRHQEGIGQPPHPGKAA